VGLGAWVEGARPRTLPASIAPVVAATGLAARLGHLVVARALLAAVVALALQVGVNYANDYSDGVRGTDERRVGPVRLVGQGLASPLAVRRAAFAAFAVAGVAGLVLASETSWWLLALGASAIAAAWLYTGGPRPYGYAGLGEVFAFAYFGLFATLGTLWVQACALTLAGWLVAVALGFAISAILLVNNLRDLEGDAGVGKHTLAVRLGDGATRVLFVALIAGAVVLAAVAGSMASRTPLAGVLVGAVGAAFAVPALAPVVRAERGPRLVASLAASGRLTLALGVALAAAAVWLR
jgi:1,4-dihydroxy-2-naphthoate octaprenyltransferase